MGPWKFGFPENLEPLKKLGVLNPKAGSSLLLISGDEPPFAFDILLLYNTLARFRVIASSNFEDESSSKGLERR